MKGAGSRCGFTCLLGGREDNVAEFEWLTHRKCHDVSIICWQWWKSYGVEGASSCEKSSWSYGFVDRRQNVPEAMSQHFHRQRKLSRVHPAYSSNTSRISRTTIQCNAYQVSRNLTLWPPASSVSHWINVKMPARGRRIPADSSNRLAR